MKGCLTVIGGVVVVLVVIGAVASRSTTTGPTSSPALVTDSTASTPTEAAAEPAAPQTFKGNGSENLGVINVPTASTLNWTCQGCSVFGVDGISTSGTGAIAVASQNHSEGVTAVEPGTYKSVSVIADEEESRQGWSITITAR
jgi:hypothetical protein